VFALLGSQESFACRRMHSLLPRPSSADLTFIIRRYRLPNDTRDASEFAARRSEAGLFIELDLRGGVGRWSPMSESSGIGAASSENSPS